MREKDEEIEPVACKSDIFAQVNIPYKLNDPIFRASGLFNLTDRDGTESEESGRSRKNSASKNTRSKQRLVISHASKMSSSRVSNITPTHKAINKVKIMVKDESIKLLRTQSDFQLRSPKSKSFNEKRNFLANSNNSSRKESLKPTVYNDYNKAIKGALKGQMVMVKPGWMVKNSGN